ncbi:unnamed protein product [Orchesella dallaii]|uniref:Uncharacterized protein n=1 Tax=Orchesella dallaii TaxID=48710 RepID=A0ABP1S3A2_9HEXA
MAILQILIIYYIAMSDLLPMSNSLPVTKLPSKTTAIFYESPEQEGIQISYRDTAEEWSQLQSLFESSNVQTPSLLCVRGVWLIYGDTGFRAPTNDDVHLISGNDNCIKPPDVSTIGSMQPVSATKFSESSITIYSKGNFASIGAVFSDDGDVGVRQLNEPLADIGSVMVVGSKSWSLLSSDGKIICVRPQLNDADLESLPICYSPDLDRYSIPNFQTVAVKPDCPDEHDAAITANFRLFTCKQFGSEDIEQLQSPTGIMGRSLGGGAGEAVLECRKTDPLNRTKFTEDQSKLILDLLQLRLVHDFNSLEQTLWPDAKEDLWRVIPLDTAFDIMIMTVPNHVVNLNYLRVLREFTVFHLNEMWKEETLEVKLKESKKWKNYKVITHLLEQCLKSAFNNRARYNSVVAASYSQSEFTENTEQRIHPSFVMEPDHDPVIETAWVVTNYAMALCHELFDYRFNFWDNYVLTFNSLYFQPLEKRWKKPTQILPQTFRVILSGFGVNSEYTRISFATTVLLDLTPNLHPFEKYYKTKK